MNTKLNHVQDWLTLTKQANWSVSKMAALTGVTRRTLHRHFLKHFGQSSKHWLHEQRLKLAVELLWDGSSVKETAMQLGYKHAETFSHDFKKRYGQYPTKLANAPNNHEMSHLII